MDTPMPIMDTTESVLLMLSPRLMLILTFSMVDTSLQEQARFDRVQESPSARTPNLQEEYFQVDQSLHASSEELENLRLCALQKRKCSLQGNAQNLRKLKLQPFGGNSKPPSWSCRAYIF